MAAPNAQPFGSRGTAATPNEHDCYGCEGGTPSSGNSPLGQGVAPHSTPKPVGNGKGNPLH